MFWRQYATYKWYAYLEFLSQIAASEENINIKAFKINFWRL